MLSPVPAPIACQARCAPVSVAGVSPGAQALRTDQHAQVSTVGDGSWLLRQIRCDPVHADTSVLALGAHHFEADRDRASALGANSYLTNALQLRPLSAMVDFMMMQ
ncbi:hypothetical protein ENSA5_33740 [Enhygromyxa salina]|uniref:Uncharacterized protein n=2 Tax=Enhygromyxa salina TaxID=215803 RepID=A0A2S9XXN0_9BACT|nr:hypothetical protein ENSA5_33740 [Enhygromyxa salina]